MSKEIDLECPSGLRVRLRGIKGKDLDGMRDRRRLQTGEAFSKLLDDCTLEVLAVGPYTTQPNKAISWKQVLVGDRTRALIGLRTATSGAMFGFRVRCANDVCRAWIDWDVSLLDLPVKVLSPESRAQFVTGNRFETSVDGRKVIFRLVTGEDQLRAVRLQERFLATQKRQKERGESAAGGQTLLGLSSKIVEVEGVQDVMAYLSELDFEDIAQLVRKMDRADCGIETTLDVVCDQCSEAMTTELPLDATFFRPTAMVEPDKNVDL